MLAIVLTLLPFASQSLVNKGEVIQIAKPTDISSYNIDKVHYNLALDEGDIVVKETVSFLVGSGFFTSSYKKQ